MLCRIYSGLSAAFGVCSGWAKCYFFFPSTKIKIWKFRSVKDISTGMYVIYTFSVILWLIYGIIINSEPLILAEILTLILVCAILTMKYLWK